MNEVVMLHQISPAGMLQEMMKENVPLNLSAFRAGRWHVNRVLLTDIRADTFDVRVSPRKKNEQNQLNTDQSVGISFRCEYGQGTFIFNTKVVALKSSLNDEITDEVLVLQIPEQIEVVQKQNFKRVQVPASLDVDVALWHKNVPNGKASDNHVRVLHGFKGALINISAGGLQVAIQHLHGPALEKEQFVHLEFVPLPNETPLKFNAYVRKVLPDAHQDYMLIGLQIVGLEASSEGRMVLQRICSIVQQYRQMNESRST
jgi:hypothetical protein